MNGRITGVSAPVVEAIQTVTEYIEVFYRRQRKKAKLGYLPSIVF